MIKPREWGRCSWANTHISSLIDLEEEGREKKTRVHFCASSAAHAQQAAARRRPHAHFRPAFMNKKSAYKTLKLHILKSRLRWASLTQSGVRRTEGRTVGSLLCLRWKSSRLLCSFPPPFFVESKATPLKELRQKMRILKVALQVSETLRRTSRGIERNHCRSSRGGVESLVRPTTPSTSCRLLSPPGFQQTKSRISSARCFALF